MAQESVTNRITGAFLATKHSFAGRNKVVDILYKLDGVDLYCDAVYKEKKF